LALDKPTFKIPDVSAPLNWALGIIVENTAAPASLTVTQTNCSELICTKLLYPSVKYLMGDVDVTEEATAVGVSATTFFS